MLEGWMMVLALGPGVHSVPVDVREFLEQPASLDPDEPRFEYGLHNRRWQAMAGGRLGLWGVDHPRFRFALALSGFVELVNFSTQAVPWQTFRAHVGFDTLWRPQTPRLQARGGQVIVQLGWHHESDHAADLIRYQREFLAPGGMLDNSNFSAFEAFKLKVDWTQGWAAFGAPRLTTNVAPAVRGFTPSINAGDLRRPAVGLACDLRLQVELTPRASLFVGAFGEWVHHRFDPAAHGVLADASDFAPPEGARPLITRALRTGIELGSERRTMLLVPQVGYENGNGRGVDFMRRYGHTVVFALTIHR